MRYQRKARIWKARKGTKLSPRSVSFKRNLEAAHLLYLLTGSIFEPSNGRRV